MHRCLCRAAYIREVGYQRLLRLNSKLTGKRVSKSTLGSTRNVVSQNIVLRILEFAHKLEVDVQNMKQQRQTCKSILDDKGLPKLPDFLKEFEGSLSETRRLWSGAHNLANIVGWLRSPHTHSFIFASRESAISMGIWTHRESGIPLLNGHLEKGKKTAVRQVHLALCIANCYKQS